MSDEDCYLWRCAKEVSHSTKPSTEFRENEETSVITQGLEWRRGSESNRRIKVLQTSPLPLGYRAPAHHVSVPCGKCPSAGNDRVWSENWSGRRDLNPRLRPWQGRTLPLSYSRSLPHSKSLPTTTSNHCTRQVLSSGVNLSRNWPKP